MNPGETENVPPLDRGSFVVRSSKMVEAEVNGEIVALHVEKGECFGLNKVGARVWQLAASPIRVSDICAAIRNEYDDVPPDFERDIFQLLEGLRLEELIELHIPAPANS